MGALLDVILPVFLVLGAGYAARARNLFSDDGVDGLMVFTQRFAIPCLLFKAIAGIDLTANFDVGLLSSFYIGVACAGLLGALGARFLFNRPPEDCVAIGFGAFFSNSVLLGLPIMERAYGTAALAPNYTLVAFHAPLLYATGIIAMELVRSRGQGISTTVFINILKSLFGNALVIGILLGFAVNLTQFVIPDILNASLDMMIRAALPAALFGLGGVLYRYRPEGDMRVIMWVALVSLIAHPAITWALGTQVFNLTTGQLRAAIVTSAMAPGVNTYVFANMYGAARRVAASSVLICTALSLVTASVWLTLLP